MAGRKANAAEGVPITLTLSRQSIQALNQLASMGIYGRGASEVAGRFVDNAIQKMVSTPTITISLANENEPKKES